MKNRIMITGVKPADYLSGFFRDNEAILTAEERAAALVKGWDIAGVEGGSDEIYHYRIPANLAPDDIGKWSFKAVEIDCSGASGRTWGNGQKGPMDADVTFNAVEIKQIDLAALSADAERRAQQAQTQSDAYKLQRAALTALETKVKERLAKVQAAEGGKSSK
jgi:hypothetical protein